MRLIAVTVAEVLCVIGTLAGVGVFGGPEVAQAAGGGLSADATLIAPATQVFSIWSVIYVGLGRLARSGNGSPVSDRGPAPPDRSGGSPRPCC